MLSQLFILKILLGKMKFLLVFFAGGLYLALIFPLIALSKTPLPSGDDEAWS